jgi:hypothetical protein
MVGGVTEDANSGACPAAAIALQSFDTFGPICFNNPLLSFSPLNRQQAYCACEAPITETTGLP